MHVLRRTCAGLTPLPLPSAQAPMLTSSSSPEVMEGVSEAPLISGKPASRALAAHRAGDAASLLYHSVIGASQAHGEEGNAAAGTPWRTYSEPFCKEGSSASMRCLSKH